MKRLFLQKITGILFFLQYYAIKKYIQSLPKNVYRFHKKEKLAGILIVNLLRYEINRRYFLASTNIRGAQSGGH